MFFVRDLIGSHIIIIIVYYFFLAYHIIHTTTSAIDKCNQLYKQCYTSNNMLVPLTIQECLSCLDYTCSSLSFILHMLVAFLTCS